MADNIRKTFAGTLITTTDNFLLAAFDGSDMVDLDLQRMPVAFFDDQLDRKAVSVLGRMGERAIGTSHRVPSLLAEKVVSQARIAERAFDRHQANPTAEALDNWLRAERELLESTA